MNSESDFVPVFVVGAARSGTTILGKLLSAHPDFFDYKAETLILEVCRLKYGNIFRSETKKEEFLKDWFNSRQFERSNLTKDEFRNLVARSHSYPVLLINFLRKMAAKDGKRYIVDSTPSNILSISDIVSVCPEAKIIRVVRDGRDVAISQVKLGWSNPPPPYRKKTDFFHYAMVAWQFSQRHFERNLNLNCKTIYFEEIIQQPEKILKELGFFIGCSYSLSDFQYVLENEKNTAFRENADISPIGRWRTKDEGFIRDISFNVTQTLQFHGYVCAKKLGKIEAYCQVLLFFMVHEN